MLIDTKTIVVLLIFGALYIFSSWVWVMISVLKLSNKLYKDDYNTWVYLTSFGRFGPGLGNPFRSIPYFYSLNSNENPEILRLKGKIRIGIRNTIHTALGMLIGVMVILWVVLSSGE